MRILKGHEGIVHALLFSPNGERLFSAGKDGTLRTWSIRGESAIFPASGKRPQAFAFSADGRHLAIGGSDGGLRVCTTDVEAFSVKETKVEGPISGLSFLSDDRSVVFALGTPAKEIGVTAGSIRFWDWQENRLRPLPVDIAPTIAVRDLAFLAAHRLMAWATRNNMLTIWPITRSTVTRLNLKNPCRSIALSPDGKTLAATADWKVLLFDIERKHERATLNEHKGMVGNVAFSPDGRHLLTGSWDKSVRVWDASNGRELASYHFPIGRVGTVAYAPDGLRAAAAGDEGTIIVWDVEQ